MMVAVKQCPSSNDLFNDFVYLGLEIFDRRKEYCKPYRFEFAISNARC